MNSVQSGSLIAPVAFEFSSGSDSIYPANLRLLSDTDLLPRPIPSPSVDRHYGIPVDINLFAESFLRGFASGSCIDLDAHVG